MSYSLLERYPNGGGGVDIFHNYIPSQIKAIKLANKTYTENNNNPNYQDYAYVSVIDDQTNKIVYYVGNKTEFEANNDRLN